MTVTTLAERIRHFIAKSGLRVEDIAEKIGVSQGAVSQWQTGDSSPRQRRLEKLVEVLGIDMATLYGPLDEEAEESTPPTTSGSDEDAEGGKGAAAAVVA
jgi:transcriptional regulator with XRE-family HTH domain